MHHHLQLEQLSPARSDRLALLSGQHHGLTTAKDLGGGLRPSDAIEEARLHTMQFRLVLAMAMPDDQRDMDGLAGGTQTGQPNHETAFADGTPSDGGGGVVVEQLV